MKKIFLCMFVVCLGLASSQHNHRGVKIKSQTGSVELGIKGDVAMRRKGGALSLEGKSVSVKGDFFQAKAFKVGHLKLEDFIEKTIRQRIKPHIAKCHDGWTGPFCDKRCSGKNCPSPGPGPKPQTPKGAKLLGGSGNVKKNTKLKSMDIPLDYEIGLDIIPNNKIEKNWANIVHFTATGKDCCGYGSRIPGVWFWPGTRKLLVVDGHTANGNSHTGEWKCNDKLLTLQANKKYKLRMVFQKKTVSVYVNGQSACKNIPRSDRKVFKNVQVYVGDPWYAPANAKVANLYFKAS